MNKHTDFNLSIDEIVEEAFNRNGIRPNSGNDMRRARRNLKYFKPWMEGYPKNNTQVIIFAKKKLWLLLLNCYWCVQTYQPIISIYRRDYFLILNNFARVKNIFNSLLHKFKNVCKIILECLFVCLFVYLFVCTEGYR